MATVSPTWTSGSVIGTVLAGFSALMDPASPSAMEGGGGCLVQERNPASRRCAERHVVLSRPSILSICLFTKIKSAVPTFAKQRLF